MAHPRIEEVEDSDVDMSDPSEGDIDDFDEADIMRPRNTNTAAPSKQPPAAPQHLFPTQPQAPPLTATADAKAYAGFHCLYPVYFDARRTRAQGRRVSAALAVENPLAREVVTACRALRLQAVWEPDKTHPKDWANPGRVRIAPLNKGKNTVSGVKNKHQLYILIAQHLRDHPTTEASEALWERIHNGMAAPERGGAKGYPRPAVPRGWKVGEFVPYWSHAITGGGESESMFKDLMKGMTGAGGGMPGGMPGGMDMASLMSAMGGGMGGDAPQVEEGAGKKKKEKKGKGKA